MYFRCLDTSGGYLFHDPKRSGCIIETCVALHNCAKLAKVKLLHDFPSKDGFRRITQKIVQPVNVGHKERLKFKNLRQEYIHDFFTPK